MSSPSDWRDALASLLPEGHQSEPEPDTDSNSAVAPVQAGVLHVQVERKGRAGKVATIVSGFTIPDDAVADVASRLKHTLGTGGSARGGEILIQGDRADDVVAALGKLGLKARRV